MYIITAVPLVAIPRGDPSTSLDSARDRSLGASQVFSYFFSEDFKKGSIIEVPLGRSKAKAIVLGSEPLSSKKQDLRGATYKLKGVKSVFNQNAVLSAAEIKFADWISEYFFASAGLVFKTITPDYLLQRKGVDFKSREPIKGSGFSFEYMVSPSRQYSYFKIVAKNIKRGRQTMVLFPSVFASEEFFNRLPLETKAQAVLFSSRFSPKQKLGVHESLVQNEAKTKI